MLTCPDSMDTGIIGPVTDMEDFVAQFGGSRSATIHGLIVSSILIPAAISSFFAGFVADRFGRSKGISIGVFIFGVGAALEAAAVHLAMFIVGRVVEGVGEGLFLGTLVVYALLFEPPSQSDVTNLTPLDTFARYRQQELEGLSQQDLSFLSRLVSLLGSLLATVPQESNLPCHGGHRLLYSHHFR